MSRPELIGTVLAGRYKIMGVIGEGGMGSVYLGEQIAMGRKTAIKVLHADDDDEASIARFRRGSRNAARIDHPNVCRIFEYGDPPGGLHFLAMELIKGESIHALMTRRGAIPLGRATRIMEQTASALHAAHTLGIVHRDLKPGNIMLTRGSEGEEVVKVVDFDIAKAPSDTFDEEITQLDWMVGTPLYMSPEQLKAQPLDRRSDIYSLGIVLFRMVAGAFPFSDATNPWTIMAERMASPPRPLSEAAPDLEFPPELQQVFDRALEMEPEDRWPDAQEFRKALLEAVGPIVDEIDPLEEESYDEPEPEEATAETAMWEAPGGEAPTPESAETAVWVPPGSEAPTPKSAETAVWVPPGSEAPAPESAEAAVSQAPPGEPDAQIPGTVVQQQIPATMVAPKPPTTAPGSSASPLRRAGVAAVVTLALGAGAWGAYTTFFGSPEITPPVSAAAGAEQQLSGSGPAGLEQAGSVQGGSGQGVESVTGNDESVAGDDVSGAGADGPDAVEQVATGGDLDSLAVGPGVESSTEAAEQELSELERQLALFGDEMPLAEAEDAQSAATRISDQSPGNPALQSRALDVSTQAQEIIDGYRLSELQGDLDSYLFSRDGVPDAVAREADREGRVIFDRNADRPDLQARAAFVRAMALGGLEEWVDAVDWAQQAVTLDPGNQEYQVVLDGFRANLPPTTDA